MRASFLSCNASFGSRSSFVAGPSGRRRTSRGSTGQADGASRTFVTAPTETNPGTELTRRTDAPKKDRFVWAQFSALPWMIVVPHVSSVVLVPSRVTVPRIPPIDTGNTRPPESFTVTGFVVRNFAVRVPLEVTARMQSPSTVGGAV